MVADEVSNLAQKTQKATEEIQTILTKLAEQQRRLINQFKV